MRRLTRLLGFLLLLLLVSVLSSDAQRVSQPSPIGKGTANVVPKWRSGGIGLQDSQIHDDGTLVTIGTDWEYDGSNLRLRLGPVPPSGLTSSTALSIIADNNGAGVSDIILIGLGDYGTILFTATGGDLATPGPMAVNQLTGQLKFGAAYNTTGQVVGVGSAQARIAGYVESLTIDDHATIRLEYEAAKHRFWDDQSNNRLEINTNGVLLPTANSYLNFSTTAGSSGYGIRDNAGTIECKNSGGSWAACTGGSAAFSSLTTGTNTTATMTVGTGASLTTSGSGTVNANQYKGNSIVAVADGGTGQTTLTGLPLVTPSLTNPSLGTSGVTQTYANDTTTGTTAKLLAKLTTDNPVKVVKVSTSDTQSLGICKSGCATSGNAEIVTEGRTTCTFENAATADNLVIIGTGTAGNCRDAGTNSLASVASTTRTIGRVVDGGAAGDHDVQLFGGGIFGTQLPSTVVQTNQTNTYSTGTQDFTSATALVTKVGAGYAPTANGSVGYDTTQDAYVSGGYQGSTVKGIGVLCAGQNGSTVDAASGAQGTNETNFTPNCTIPANLLIANKTLRVTAGYQFTTSGAPPTLTLRLKMGSTVLVASSTIAMAINQTSDVTLGQYLVMGTGAAGASVNTYTSGVPFDAPNATAGFRTATAQPVAVATNASQTLQISAQWTTNVSGNTIQLINFLVEVLN